MARALSFLQVYRRPVLVRLRDSDAPTGLEVLGRPTQIYRRFQAGANLHPKRVDAR